MRRRSVLYLTCHLPFPPIGGGRRRDYEVLRRLAAYFDMSLCVVSKTPHEDRRNAAKLKEYCSTVQIFPADTDVPAARNGPYQVARHRAAGARSWIDDLVVTGGVEVVHVEGYYLMQHVHPATSVPVLLVEENIEYLLFSQAAASEPESGRRRLLQSQYELTRVVETAAWKQATLCGVVSADDRRHMERTMRGGDIRLTPDGADHLDTEAGPSRWRPGAARHPLIVFIANFAYEPNVDAASFLCRAILPHIRAAVPDVRLQLVGAEPSPDVLELGRDPGVTVVGQVPSVVPHLERADVVVCPLRVGGGIKVKLLEAIRRGKAIVTTSVGAQGMPPGIARCVEVRDDPVDFARATAALLTSDRSRRRLERAAAGLGTTLPTWDDAAAALAGCYRELIGLGDMQSRCGSNAVRRIVGAVDHEQGGEKCGT